MEKIIILTEMYLIDYFYKNYDIYSDKLPDWLLVLGAYNVAISSKFSNPEEANINGAAGLMFDQALSTVWLRKILESTETGELDINMEYYDHARFTYLDIVRKRFKIISESNQLIKLEYSIEPFMVFTLDDINIKTYRNDKSDIQKIKTEEKRLIQEASKTVIDTDKPN